MSEAPLPGFVADGLAPPQALDMEAAVVGSMMIDPAYAIPVVSALLEPDHFYHAPYKRLYATLTAMFRAGEPIYPLTIQERLRGNGWLELCGGASGLVHVMNTVPTVLAADHYAGVVLDMANRRALVERLNEAALRAHDPNFGLDYVLNDTEAALGQVRANLPAVGSRLPALRCAADITARPVDWVWPRYLARGAITMLEGDPGRGKGFITIDLAARITQGDTMPDGTAGVHGTVLFLTGEDSPEYTERPRLEAAGADLSRVYFLPEKGQGQRWDLTSDAEALQTYVRQIGADLLVIDPITEFLPAVDTHRDNEVRRVLAGLRDIAVHAGCAVLAVRHLNKGAGMAAMYRGGGSIAFTGAARFVFTVGVDPDDKTRRALATTKNNLTQHAPTLLYRITSCGPVGCVAWEGTSELSADEVLQTPKERPKDAAEEFLREVLEDGPITQRALEQQADERGISPATLRRAKERLKVQSVRTGTVWEWRLQGVQSSRSEHLEGAQTTTSEHCGFQDVKALKVLTPESEHLDGKLSILTVGQGSSGSTDPKALKSEQVSILAETDPNYDPFGDE
ncbi:MAG: AAA family ATPase [Armatimonadetes bacterium]|nr:AAA family ATPase [Armatimonadota bacterium]